MYSLGLGHRNMLLFSTFLSFRISNNISYITSIASKQMLYGVYGNVMTILEEHERRLTDRKMPKSKIAIPDQSRKKDEDVG